MVILINFIVMGFGSNLWTYFCLKTE